jgi:hypothetical protein
MVLCYRGRSQRCDRRREDSTSVDARSQSERMLYASFQDRAQTDGSLCERGQQRFDKTSVWPMATRGDEFVLLLGAPMRGSYRPKASSSPRWIFID